MSSIAVLLLSLTSFVPQTQDPRAEAERLAAAGQHAEALRRLQELVASNPDDIAARVAIGRLHLSAGQPDRAAAVFESVVATHPQNVDALLGLALARMDSGRWREASDALNRAEALAAERIDVLAAHGRYHAAERRPALALAYYDRALVVEPDNVEIRAASDAVRAARAHRVELGYDFQKFDGARDGMHAGTIEINARVSETVRVFARGQAQHFPSDSVVSDENDARGGGGGEWTAARGVHLRAGAMFGSDNVWLPTTDIFAEATFARRRTRWTLSVRYFDFDVADLWIGGPGVEFDATSRVTLLAKYLRGRTTVPFGDSSTSDSITIGASARLARHVRGSVAYHHGIEHLDWLTVDRVDADDANTVSLALAADVTPFVNLSAAYDYHDRPGGFFTANRARAWLVFRF